MQVVQEKFQLLDKVMHDYLRGHPNMQDRWLLEQTFYTGSTRRSIFQYFPFQPNTSVLDAGTGFGALALGLAGQIPVTVHAVDNDKTKLNVARELYDQLDRQEYFHSNSELSFDCADLYSLPYDDEQFDFVIARYVYQHLHDPLAVSRELNRVVRTDGWICLIDVDDQFSISYPETSNGYEQLQRAFAALQAQRGGDRFVGRKLSTYLQQAGFRVQATAIQPQAQHQLIQPDDPGRHFILQRLNHGKSDLIASGIMSENEFDHCISNYVHQQETYQFNANAQIVVIANKS